MPGESDRRIASLNSTGSEAQHLSRLAFGPDLERAAAYLAIGREVLRRNAGINCQLETLAAKGALNGF